MDKQAGIERAISKLANTMRNYVEANIRFKALFKVDPEEAIDNVDNAFEMKLERFHSLYDVFKSHFKYFDHGETALLIALRNAVHHQEAPLFTSLNRRLHIEGDRESKEGASFLLAGHQTAHDGEILMSHFLRLDDLDSRLNPSLNSKYLDNFLTGPKAEKRFEIINDQLCLEAIRERALRDRYPADQVYLDLMPIFVSAVCRIFRAAKDAGLEFKGFDAQTYEQPFVTEIEVDLSDIDFKRLWLRGNGPLDLIPVSV